MRRKFPKNAKKMQGVFGLPNKSVSEIFPVFGGGNIAFIQKQKNRPEKGGFLFYLVSWRVGFFASFLSGALKSKSGLISQSFLFISLKLVMPERIIASTWSSSGS